MIITPQLIFFIAGIAALVVAAILFVIAMTYYTRQDIRGVKNDLAGKARQGQRSNAVTRGRTSRRVGAPSNVRPSVNQGAPANAMQQTPVAAAQNFEDDTDTVLDTKLRRVPQNIANVNSYSRDVNDDIPTVVTSVGDYHRQGVKQNQTQNDADVPTLVEENEEELPTQVEKTAAAEASSFVVTKSILAIHSNEIITAG